MNSAAHNTAAEALPSIAKAVADAVTFTVGVLTLSIVHTARGRFGINTFTLTISHPEGGSVTYTLTQFRGEWSMGARAAGDDLPPSEISDLARAVVEAFNASRYWDRQPVGERYSLAEQVARIDLAPLAAIVAVLE